MVSRYENRNSLESRLVNATTDNNIEEVKECLRSDDLDINYWDGWALENAFNHGNEECAILLLSDPRIKPVTPTDAHLLVSALLSEMDTPINMILSHPGTIEYLERNTDVKIPSKYLRKDKIKKYLNNL